MLPNRVMGLWIQKWTTVLVGVKKNSVCILWLNGVEIPREHGILNPYLQTCGHLKERKCMFIPGPLAQGYFRNIPSVMCDELYKNISCILTTYQGCKFYNQAVLSWEYSFVTGFWLNELMMQFTYFKCC